MAWRCCSNSVAWFDALPETFRSTIDGVATTILKGYPDTLGIVVVGSVAENVHDDDSDVDVLYVREVIIPKEAIISIKQAWPLAHFIVRKPERLMEEWRDGSILAWSLRRGVVVHDPEHMLGRLLTQDPRVPSREWIIQRARYVAGWPSDTEGLRRKVLNLGFLMLARKGVVLTTKHHLRLEFPRHIHQPLLRTAIDAVLVRGDLAREQRCAAEAHLLAEAVEALLAQIESP